MEIRDYSPDDCKILAELFHQTVHAINKKDYTPKQLDAWATGQVDTISWNGSFLSNHTLVAQQKGIVIGFGDMTHSGYLDRLYVHRDYQGQGVATAIVALLEDRVACCGIARVTTHASLTARGFFERRGYAVVCRQTVVRSGVTLDNIEMVKCILP